MVYQPVQNPSSRTGIQTILNSIHPSMMITEESIKIVQDLIKPIETELNLANTDIQITEIFRTRLSGSLAKHASAEYTRYNKIKSVIIEYLI